MTDSAKLLQQFEKLHPKMIDLSLNRIKHLCRKLNDPHLHLPPVIHIAGTNGKGSVLAFLEAILKSAGKRVHTFTSPHLIRFHERIHLANADGTNAPISEDALIDILLRTEKANGDDPITFFEITTAAAFLAFSETPADLLLLETGLGGRLDATNIVEDPLLTIITSISIDHTSFLGETIEQIAYEKAGIIKKGVPLILAPQEETVFAEIEARADAQGAPLLAAGHHWSSLEQHGRLVYQTQDSLLDLPLPNLTGRHQITNAGVAITAARALPNVNLSITHIEEGLRNATWPARLERLHLGGLHALTCEETEIWFDGGHNPGAAQVLAETMAELEEKSSKPLHLICAMMQNKDAKAFFDAFTGLAECVIAIPLANQINGAPAAELAALAQKAGLNAFSANDLKDAMAISRQVLSEKSNEPARLLICGSLYLAETVYDHHDVAVVTETKSPGQRPGL